MLPRRTSTRPTRGSCWRPGATYRIDCNRCKEKGLESIYWGESGHSSYYWGLQHLEGLERKKADNVLFTHQVDFHPLEKLTMKDFTMTTVASYSRPTVRQSREGVEIGRTIRDIGKGCAKYLMNSKREFIQPGIVRTSPSPLL